MTQRALDTAIVLFAASLLLILAFGGIDADLGPVRLRLHDWMRPAVLLGLALAVRFWFAPSAFALRPSMNTLALLALLFAIAGGYLEHHVRVAGGLDSYGYVSAASLLASGRLTEPQQLTALLPFEEASAAAAPLGYVPGPDGHTNVPRFPLGLPLVMALFKIFGPGGPFYVPLLMAFGTMALAYAMGREQGIPEAGLFAAAIVGVDPLLAHYGMQPMSDVPATFWLIAAVWLRLERPRAAIAAGFCAGMAILTRPALLPAVIVLGAVTAGRRSARDVAFAAVVIAFVAAQMMVNRVLYGSFLASGYGPASHMFEISVTRLAANVANFGKWLAHSHTPVVWLLWPMALVILRGRPWAWQVSAVAAAAAVPYLFYLVFDDWESSRFLLPTIVLVLILFARALSVALSHLPHPSHLPHLPHLLFPLLAFLCAFASHRFLEREGVYRFGSVEAKYALVGEWFKTHTSGRTVVLAGLHSGSIRLYGERETLRWDQIPADQLRATLQSLEGAGYEPYLALDNPSEPPLFDSRFRSDAGVTLEPVARVRVVNIYRLR
ncbi:MAG: hypothetical protein ND807_07550 [Vicinamibacterales bacterium]|nr:hypothetical protein [Vicinamibacterales bacterium]